MKREQYQNLQYNFYTSLETLDTDSLVQQRYSSVYLPDKALTQFRLSPGASHVLLDRSATGKLVSVPYNHISIYFFLTGCWCHDDTEYPPQQQCHLVSLNTARLRHAVQQFSICKCYASKTTTIQSKLQICTQ